MKITKIIAIVMALGLSVSPVHGVSPVHAWLNTQITTQPLPPIHTIHTVVDKIKEAVVPTLGAIGAGWFIQRLMGEQTQELASYDQQYCNEYPSEVDGKRVLLTNSITLAKVLAATHLACLGLAGMSMKSRDESTKVVCGVTAAALGFLSILFGSVAASEHIYEEEESFFEVTEYTNGRRTDSYFQIRNNVRTAYACMLIGASGVVVAPILLMFALKETLGLSRADGFSDEVKVLLGGMGVLAGSAGLQLYNYQKSKELFTQFLSKFCPAAQSSATEDECYVED